MNRVVLLGGSIAVLKGPISNILNNLRSDAVLSRGISGAPIERWKPTVASLGPGDLALVLEFGGNGNHALTAPEVDRRVREIGATGALQLWVAPAGWPANSRVADRRKEAHRSITSTLGTNALPIFYDVRDLAGDGVHLNFAGARKTLQAIFTHPQWGDPVRTLFRTTGRLERSSSVTQELVAQRPTRPASRSAFGAADLARLAPLMPIFERAAAEIQVPLRLLVAVAWWESRWLSGDGPTPSTSASGRPANGGWGIMQVVSDTAAGHGLPHSRTRELLLPEVNIPIGARVLRAEHEKGLRFGQRGWSFAVRAFNCGAGPVLCDMNLRPWSSVGGPGSEEDKAKRIAKRRERAAKSRNVYLPGVTRTVRNLVDGGIV